MQELKNAVAAAFDNVVASGAIEKAIQEQIGKTIESAIKEQFSSYGDFSKAVKAKVSSLVDVNLDQIDLPSYRDLVGKIIRERVGAVMTEQFTTQLGNDIDSLLKPAPAEITLEDLLEDFITQQMDAYNAHEYRGENFSLHIEHSDSPAGYYIHVYLDKERHKSKYSCGIHIDIDPQGHVYSLKIDNVDPAKKLFIGPMYGFEHRLFQLYTAKSKIIIPPGATEGDFSTCFPYGDDD